MHAPGFLLKVTFVTYNLYDLLFLTSLNIPVSKAGTREMARLVKCLAKIRF